MATLARQLISRQMILSVGAACLCAIRLAMAAEIDPTDADGSAMLARYEAAAKEGDVVAAVGHLLDYSVLTRGEDAPQTAKLTHRYGVLLMRNGDYLEATKVLKTALDRTNAAFGEFSREAFDINMNIGYASSQTRRGRHYRARYFDRALEVLRKRGERETILYVTALLNIVGNLADNDGLSGDTSTTVVDNLSMLEGNERLLNLQYDYRNTFHIAEEYLDEAAEIAANLEHEDEYLLAKVNIARVKLGVLETADWARVPMGVSGRITQQTVIKRNDRHEEQLAAAITVLSRDSVANAAVLAAANATLFDIAWLDNDKSRMEAMCASGSLDSSADYPSDRLFRIQEDGSVIAPDFGFHVPPNLFTNKVRALNLPKDADGKKMPHPYYVPVCINGELMAALINAPRVIIEEYQ